MNGVMAAPGAAEGSNSPAEAEGTNGGEGAAAPEEGAGAGPAEKAVIAPKDAAEGKGNDAPKKARARAAAKGELLLHLS